MALSQTFAEIAEEISTQSWVLMDEEQRDALMRNVIVPRWGETTADGVVLKATAWGRMLGATEESVRGRYRRLTSRSEAQEGRSPSPEPTPSQSGQIRGAAAAIRRHPELAEKLVADPEVERALRQAQQRKARTDAEAVGSLMRCGNCSGWA